MIPPEIRDAIGIAERVLSYAGDGLVCIEYDASEIRGALRILRAYLDTLHAAPAPDWSAAPSWATHHVYNCKGSGLWTGGECVMNETWISGWSGVVPGVTKSDYSGYRLPIGIDWRETLVARPQEDK